MRNSTKKGFTHIIILLIILIIAIIGVAAFRVFNKDSGSIIESNNSSVTIVQDDLPSINDVEGVTLPEIKSSSDLQLIESTIDSLDTDISIDYAPLDEIILEVNSAF